MLSSQGLRTKTPSTSPSARYVLVTTMGGILLCSRDCTKISSTSPTVRLCTALTRGKVPPRKVFCSTVVTGPREDQLAAPKHHTGSAQVSAVSNKRAPSSPVSPSGSPPPCPRGGHDSHTRNLPCSSYRCTRPLQATQHPRARPRRAGRAEHPERVGAIIPQETRVRTPFSGILLAHDGSSNDRHGPTKRGQRDGRQAESRCAAGTAFTPASTSRSRLGKRPQSHVAGSPLPVGKEARATPTSRPRSKLAPGTLRGSRGAANLGRSVSLRRHPQCFDHAS